MPAYACINFAIVTFCLSDSSTQKSNNDRLKMLKFIYGDLNPSKIQELKAVCQQEVYIYCLLYDQELWFFLPKSRTEFFYCLFCFIPL